MRHHLAFITWLGRLINCDIGARLAIVLSFAVSLLCLLNSLFQNWWFLLSAVGIGSVHIFRNCVLMFFLFCKIRWQLTVYLLRTWLLGLVGTHLLTRLAVLRLNAKRLAHNLHGWLKTVRFSPLRLNLINARVSEVVWIFKVFTWLVRLLPRIQRCIIWSVVSLNALVHSHRSETLRVGMSLGLRVRCSGTMGRIRHELLLWNLIWSASRALEANRRLFSQVNNSLTVCLLHLLIENGSTVESQTLDLLLLRDKVSFLLSVGSLLLLSRIPIHFIIQLLL